MECGEPTETEQHLGVNPETRPPDQAGALGQRAAHPFRQPDTLVPGARKLEGQEGLQILDRSCNIAT